MLLWNEYASCNIQSSNPANTKHLYNISTTTAQRLRRWSNIGQMLYKCLVFTGNAPHGVLCVHRYLVRTISNIVMR